MNRDVWDIKMLSRPPGGQQVGITAVGVSVTHKSTGLNLTIPFDADISARKSFRSLSEAAIMGLTMTLLEIGENPDVHDT